MKDSTEKTPKKPDAPEKVEKSKELLEERLRFEELAADFSVKFVNVLPGQVDREIAGALKEICRFFGTDFCGLMEVLPDRKQIYVMNLICNEEQRRGISGMDIVTSHPWTYHRVVEQEEPLIFSSPEEIPEEAGIDRASREKCGAQALCLIPLRVRGQVTHIIGLGRKADSNVWPQLYTPRLRLLGEIFASALIHKRDQDALKKSENMLAEAQRIACLGAWDWDIVAGKLHWSEGVYRIFGLLPQEFGTTYEAFLASVHPDDRQALQQAVNESLSNPENKFSNEYRLVRPDGSERIVQARGEVMFEAGGKPVSMVGIVLDITERKQTEAALQKALEEIKRYKEQSVAENIYLRGEMESKAEFTDILGAGDPIKYVMYRIQQVAGTKTTVLLTGETGTGKGFFARILHEASKRKGKPFVHVNCAGLPAPLLESELFGREKGAFTGSTERRIGRFELANGGTIFLDEIGELPIGMQAKLLKVIEDGEFERLGNPHPVKVDVRIIVCTNRNLGEEIQKGRFRRDLFYRINVFPITIPPLRQRSEAIPLLVKIFVDRFNKSHGKLIKRIPADTMKALKDYAWPGNVRELMNVIERAVILSEGPELRLAEKIDANHLAQQGETAKVQKKTGTKSLSEVDREHILQTLQKTGWRIEGDKGAARLLEVNASTLRARMQKLGIKRPRGS